MAESTEGEKKIAFCRFLIQRKEEESLFSVTLGSRAADGAKASSARRDEETLKSGGALCFSLCRSSAPAICFHVSVCGVEESAAEWRRREQDDGETREEKKTCEWR